jgi:hypothetical protein
MYIVYNMSLSCLEKATLRRRKYKLYQLLMTNYLELSLPALSINFPLKCSSLPACLSQQGKWMSRSISVIVVKEPDKLLYLMLKSSTPPMIVNERIYHCRMVSSFYGLYCPHYNDEAPHGVFAHPRINGLLNGLGLLCFNATFNNI